MSPLSPSVVVVLVGMFAALVAGSTVRLLALRDKTTQTARSRRASLATWWGLAVLMTAAVVLGRAGVCLLLALASWLAFSEYRRLEAVEPAERLSSGLLRLTVPIVYGAVYLGWGLTVLALLPVVAVALVATSEIVHGVTRGYVRSMGAQVFGAVVLVGGLAHAGLLVSGPDAVNPVGGATGWFVFLVMLTEINDISQALVGRRLGVHHVTVVSPHKTWEGLLGGVCVTVLTAFLLAPLLTPLGAGVPAGWVGGDRLPPSVGPLVAGLAVSFAGLLGDLNLSAVKRDAGVKDSSHALPGMGGVLDRVDSLTLTAPALYWLVVAPMT